MDRTLTLDTSSMAALQEVAVQEGGGKAKANSGESLEPKMTLASPSGAYSCGSESKCPTCPTPDAAEGSSCPPHGAKAVCGRRSKMEDMFVIQPDFIPAAGLGELQPVLPRNLESGHVEQLSGGAETSAQADTEDSCTSEATSAPSWRSSSMECDDSLHLFAVYDGHGGVEAAKHCSERMHCNILKVWDHLHNEDSSTEPVNDGNSQVSSESTSSNRVVQRKTSDHVASVLHKSFVTTDTEFIQDDQSALVGSTAVVSLVGQRNICVGYCGDSRAVLCRGGKALPLTVDHKPERDDETERVQDAGGQVLFFNGARVMGLLAMSRAIGDRSLRPFVIPDPEVTIISRRPEDQLLILASDGLWDVVNNQEACTLAMRCMQKARDKGACETNAARLTATVLARAAIDRGSRDNITVVVVDLRPPLDSTSKDTETTATSQERQESKIDGASSSKQSASKTTPEKEEGEEANASNLPLRDVDPERGSHVKNEFHGEGAFEHRQGLVPVQVQP